MAWAIVCDCACLTATESRLMGCVDHSAKPKMHSIMELKDISPTLTFADVRSSESPSILYDGLYYCAYLLLCGIASQCWPAENKRFYTRQSIGSTVLLVISIEVSLAASSTKRSWSDLSIIYQKIELKRRQHCRKSPRQTVKFSLSIGETENDGWAVCYFR